MRHKICTKFTKQLLSVHAYLLSLQWKCTVWNQVIAHLDCSREPRTVWPNRGKKLATLNLKGKQNPLQEFSGGQFPKLVFFSAALDILEPLQLEWLSSAANGLTDNFQFNPFCSFVTQNPQQQNGCVSWDSCRQAFKSKSCHRRRGENEMSKPCEVPTHDETFRPLHKHLMHWSLLSSRNTPSFVSRQGWPDCISLGLFTFTFGFVLGQAAATSL